MFTQSSIQLEILKKRAYNLRWATLPEGVIPLTAADPDFPSAPEIGEAIARYAREQYFCYTPPEGLPMFKESMAAYFQNKRSIPALPDFILPVDSAAFGIYITCKAFLSGGDEAIIFDPVDFLFRYSVETVGGVAVPFAIPAGVDNVDFSQLEQLITPKTRLICLCNPLNPTGKVFKHTELEQLGKIACKHNLIILSDEIWSDIVFTPHQFTSIASISEEIRNSTITITGFSKSYGLAGLRIGAVMASNVQHYERLMNVSLHRSTIHGANVLSQVAATTALTQCEYWLNDFLIHLQAMRDLCINELNALPGFTCIAAEGCYVAFANISSTGKTSQGMQTLLMDKAKVAVVPGLKEWFGPGAEGYIRLSFATSAEILQEAFSRIKQAVA
ncbi:pyridoxal phosphate-dependent aminotransferase [Mucilaginibacter robiniae]|uniref:Aminotransferase n=1 Tax=Mucilaginibacter robiniae TaxID=2728022 RepID=A0A7L5DYR7_9SPHI|nr:pyridoxal phosphate-dependent aminotransferase [Mucilaginibacter robiniae]QJD94394.1 pyridoxal phosphate-dependent aminotransferase [Mucilaginibacter robiniae]